MPETSADALPPLTDGEGFHQLADGSPLSVAFAELGEDLRGAPESVDRGGGVFLLSPGLHAELGAGSSGPGHFPPIELPDEVTALIPGFALDGRGRLRT